MHAASSKGFTLIELLVVLVLLGLIGLLALDDLHFGSRAWERVVARQAGEEAWRTARGSVRAVVTAAVVAPEAGGGMRGDFAGTAGEAVFLAVGPDGAAGYRLALEGAAERRELVLYRKVLTGVGAVERRVLAGDVAGLALAYRADGMAAGRWADDWRADWPLPDLVRLRVTGAEGAAVPDLVMRIAAYHPSACQVAAAELGCGR